VLGPAESSKLYPLMNVSDVYGTLYSPDDGTVDPAGYCTALTRAASKLGAKVCASFDKCGHSLMKYTDACKSYELTYE
jgi:glycine/D-amino acid oxidase-like deaminating enzyme